MSTHLNISRERRVLRQRTCIGCREITDQDQLVRIVQRDARVFIDRRRSANGRGAWIHPRTLCVKNALARKACARAFRREIRDVSELEALLSHLEIPSGGKARYEGG